ncbi:MAG: hypothetical protein AUK31_05965 [Fibrobacteres bacterium CG2_30_45_31]|nr:MAG: hypothetical protein AUK31_05965 [Fibrobacteres bacterium CG2_30_45_31]
MPICCPFCKSTVVKVDLSAFDLRICPHCLAAFFPSDKTMAFRREVFDKTREIWLSILEARKADWVEYTEGACCIDHNELLIEGKLPDYGIPAHITTCCGMFHLPASVLAQILRRTVLSPTDGMMISRSAKKHNAIVVFFDSLLNLVMGQKGPSEDSIDLIQYNVKFKDILGPRP